MKFEKKRLIGFSFAFYTKNNVEEYIINSNGGLEESHERLLGADVYKNLLSFNQLMIDEQREALKEDPKKIIKDFIEALFKLEGDKNLMSYILAYLDSMIFEENSVIASILEIRKENENRDLILFLRNILASDDNVYNSIIYDSTTRILSAIYSDFYNQNNFITESESLVNFLISHSIKNTKIVSDYIMAVSLTHLLLVPTIPDFFMNHQGNLILKELFDKNSKDLQIMYYTLLNIWILSFEDDFVKFVEDPKNLIIVDILNTLKKLAREKLTRVGLKILRNLSRSTSCVSLMIDNNLIGFLTMEMRKNIKDEKMKDNMNYLIEIMEKNYKIFSSYEKFLKEIETEKLTFGPCHTSKFWKEHIKKTEKDEFAIIKKLIHLLESNDDTTQAVACFDLGEFSRLHPFSKTILESFDGKAKLMKMIEKESPLVREHGLVAIQKLMINNWQIIA